MIIIILYIVFLILIGAVSGKSRTSSNFMIANRNVGAIILATSLVAGFFDGFVLVSYTGYVYSYGWPAISLFFGILLGFLLFYLFSDKIYDEGNKNRYYGLGDFFLKRFGKKSSLLVSIFIVIFYISIALIQFIFGTRVIHEISGFNYSISLIIMAAIILSYILIGGFKAVLSTDLFQWVLIAFVVVILIVPLFNKESLINYEFSDLKAGLGNSIAFLIIGAMSIFAAPELWQRAYAARDKRNLRKGLIIAAIIFPLIGIFLALIGFTAHSSFPGIKPSEALINVFSSSLPGVFKSLGLLMLLSALMSTADTALFVIGPTIASNVFYIKDENKLKKTTSISIIISVVIIVLLSLFLRDILSIALALGSLMLALFPILFISLITKIPSQLVNISLIAGMTAVLILLLIGEINPTSSLISFPIVLVIILIGLFINKIKKNSKS